MTTILVGDTGEGAKWWSYADWAKNQLAQQHQRNRGFMQQWHQPSPDVRVHVKMVGGSVKAWIYTEGGYEFFTPETLIDFETYSTTGKPFYNGVLEATSRVLIPTESGTILNTWYSETGLVVCASLARYRNVHGKIGGEYSYTLISQAEIFPGGPTRSYLSSKIAVGAAAQKGPFVWGVQPGNTTEATVALVEDTRTSSLVGVRPLLGSWAADAVAHNSYCHGHWTFNREGTKACTVVWVQDAPRFGLSTPASTAYPTVGYVSSYVVEFEFLTHIDPDTGELVFDGVNKTQEFETTDFCIAADYDWTTEGNELITTQLSMYDYRLGAVGEWVDGTQFKPQLPGYSGPPVPWVIGDFVKTTINIGGKSRPGRLYELTSNGNLPGHPETLMVSGTRNAQGVVTGGSAVMTDRTTANSAIDEWLHLRYANGTALQSFELAHNWGTGAAHVLGSGDTNIVPASNGTWYQGDDVSQSFAIRVSGMDLRVRGMTAYSEPSGANWASVYGKEWTNGIGLPFTTATPKPANYYNPTLAYDMIKIHWIQQTIAAIPYKSHTLDVDGNPVFAPLKDVAIYAPYGDPLSANNGANTIDFKLDLHAEVDMVSNYNATVDGKGMIKYYHRDTYASGVPGGAPYLNRSFNNGVWAKRKNRP